MKSWKKDLARLADRLDVLGLQKEADFLDSILRKVAQIKDDKTGYGYWYHFYPEKDGVKPFMFFSTGPTREDYQRDAEDYLSSLGLDPSSMDRGFYGADRDSNNERGVYYWTDGNGEEHRLSFWYDLEPAKQFGLTLATEGTKDLKEVVV